MVLALVIGFIGAAFALQRNATPTTPSAGVDATPTPSVSPAPPSNTPSPSLPGGGSSSTTLDLNALAAKVDPVVVNITTKLGSNGTAAGTGMVLSATGEVLTNNHVIDGATSITGQVNGTGPLYTARIVGTDPTDDVALIQLEGASGLKTVTTADSSRVAVGDPVAAIGNAGGRGGTPSISGGSVLALDQSVTAGDPSAGTAENLTGMIEIDATLRPGDSGGPLVDTTGRVIGMNTAASVGGRFQSGTNLGFAVPVNKALSVVNEIRAGRASDRILIGQPGFLGVQVTTVESAANSSALRASGYTPPVDAGAVIVGVVPGAPADGAGMAVGDVIVSVDGKTVDAPSALTPLLRAHHPGDTVSVSWVDQSGQRHSARIKLATAPTG